MIREQLRIIVADDDAEMLGYYSRILPAMGHRAIALESNGYDLAKRVREQSPDLIITDVKMPVLNGLDAVRFIGNGIPCIVISAVDRPVDWNPPSDTRLIAYLVKPVAREQIEHAIGAALVTKERTSHN